jgi:hypothetical protein
MTEQDLISMIRGLAWLHGGASMWLSHFGRDYQRASKVEEIEGW